MSESISSPPPCLEFIQQLFHLSNRVSAEILGNGDKNKLAYRQDDRCDGKSAEQAAHIKWHQTGGPDKEQNGLAGAFTIQPNSVLLVSEQAYGRRGFEEWLLKFHGQAIREPVREATWHEKEVFKRPTREA